MEVMIEIGHKAWKNIKPNQDYTHDWTVFVQGVNGNEIKHIVEKVIFHLPDIYKDSKTIRKKPPFAVSESTSQSISVQIDVFFCTEATLGKVNYIYDMYISDEVVNISLKRKLTFSNPSKEFKAKLLLAGGEIIDLQKTPPLIMGGLQKCQIEPDDEIIILNNVDDATLNTTYQKLDIMQELLKENENLKSSNIEIKERIALQEKIKAYCEEKLSSHETHILKTNMAIKQLKKKFEDDGKEISALKLQLQIYLNDFLQIKRKRENEEDRNLSVAVGKEKENTTQTTKFISSPSRHDANTSQISSNHKNTSALTKKLKGTTSVDLKSSQHKSAVTLNDLWDTLSRNSFISESKNETLSSNYNSIHSENLCKEQNLEILDCRRNFSSAFTFSVKSTNTCGVEKSIKENLLKTDASLNKPETSNKKLKETMHENLVEADSSFQPETSLKTPEKTIIGTEKGSSAKANDSLSKFGCMNGELSAKGNYNCPKLPDGGNTAVSSLIPINTKFFERKKSIKGGKIVVGNTLESSTSSTESRMNKTLEEFDTHVQKHNASLIKTTNIKTSNSNSKGNVRKLVYFGDIALTPSNPLPGKNKEEGSKSYLQNFRNVHQSELDPHCDLNDTSVLKFTTFLTEHCQKLATELYRIKNSKFSNYRDGTNSLFYKLANIDTNPITEECWKRYQQSLIDYFTNPKTFDMATLIYVIVDYFCRERPPLESLPTYIQNQNTFVFLIPSENCIISALYQVDNKPLPHLNGLIRNTLYIIHQVIISKKYMSVNGLASLCRVFMEICKRSNDRLKPLYLCCELLRLGHLLAPYLINSLAAIWREPFTLHDQFSVEENMVVDAIMYGMKEKPLLMDNALWRLTQRLRSVYFPHPFVINKNRAIHLLTAKIVSRCKEGLFENLWMLALPLVIFVSKKSWNWKMRLRKGYILPNLLHFSKCLNEQGFGLFCNLYVDIFSFCRESPYEELLQYLVNNSFHQGVKFVQDCAAIALLKYISITDKHITTPLRDWFLRNQDNPKLAFILDLYCKKVMEYRDSFLLWDDVIIL